MNSDASAFKHTCWHYAKVGIHIWDKYMMDFGWNARLKQVMGAT